MDTFPTARSLGTFDRVISCIPARSTALLGTPTFPIKKLYEQSSVSVMVVTFFYMENSILPKRGFGYLIPRSIPYGQNPENALGVSFDSDIMPELDSAAGTKVTVMLGGHWWNHIEKSQLPSEEEGLEMGRRILER